MNHPAYEVTILPLPTEPPSQGLLLTDHHHGLQATIAPAKGAEISSLRVRWQDRWIETLYRANDFTPPPGVWQGRAPFLWPAVGRNYTSAQLQAIMQQGQDARQGSYIHGSQTYPMPIHGFIMNENWVVKSITTAQGASVTCEWTSSPTTQAFYPFDCALHLTHTLCGGSLTSSLTVTAASTNLEPMFFSCGNHLSFRLPFTDSGHFDEATLTAPTTHRLGLTPQSLLSGAILPLDLTRGQPLSNPDLHNLVITGFPADNVAVELRDPHSFGFRVAQRDASPDGPRTDPAHFHFVFYGDRQAGLFCPEPWYGGPNSLNTKQGVVFLPPGEAFVWQMILTPLGL